MCLDAQETFPEYEHEQDLTVVPDDAFIDLEQVSSSSSDSDQELSPVTSDDEDSFSEKIETLETTKQEKSQHSSLLFHAYQ